MFLWMVMYNDGTYKYITHITWWFIYNITFPPSFYTWWRIASYFSVCVDFTCVEYIMFFIENFSNLGFIYFDLGNRTCHVHHWAKSWGFSSHCHWIFGIFKHIYIVSILEYIGDHMHASSKRSRILNNIIKCTLGRRFRQHKLLLLMYNSSLV